MKSSSLARAFGIPCLLASVVFGGCGKEGDPGSGNGDCASLEVDGKKYELLFACDSPNLFGSGAHSCTEFYSNVPEVRPILQAFCTTGGGTESARCPSDGSLGSCTSTSTTATGTQGVIGATYGYPDSRGGESAASFQSDCDDGSLYAPPGAPPASNAKAGSPVISSCPRQGGVAFSLATLVNGEYEQCTNFVGDVTAEQLESVLKLGATTSSCPESRALCACTKNDSGTFGTDATLVYYETSMSSSRRTCEGLETTCDSYTESYTAP